METLQRHNLRQNHVTLVDDLDPRYVLDKLCDDGILTENDCDRINAGNTRKDRCRLLLSLLPTRGPAAYGSFLNSLKTTHDHLAKLLNCSEWHVNKRWSECNDIDPTKTAPAYSHMNVASRKRSETGKPVSVAGLTTDGLVSACSKCSPTIPNFFLPELEVVIKQNCCLILQNIEAIDLLDLHYQEYVLGGEECERIKSGKTRSERCTILISELSKCTSRKTMLVFLKSLERKYDYIIREIKKTSSYVTSDKILESTTADNSLAIVSDDLPHSVASETPQSNKEVVRQPILAEILRRGITACLANSRKPISSLGCHHQPVRFYDKQSEDECISCTHYEDTLVDKLPLQEQRNRISGGFQLPTEAPWPKTYSYSSQTSPVVSEDVEWVVRRNRYLKMERKLSDKKSQQVFPGYESSVPDSRIHDFCSTELVNKTEGNICPRKLSFNANPKEEETDETQSTFADDVDGTPCRRKCDEIPSVAEHQPSPSGSFTIGVLSNKKTDNNRVDNTFPEYVDPMNNIVNDCRRKSPLSQKQRLESKRRVLSNLSKQSALTCNPGSMQPHELRTKRLEVAFNSLSTMINQGHFDKFDSFSVKIKLKYFHDSDMMCILDYLHASRDLFITDIDSAKKHIDTGLQRVSETSNPKYFTLELFSAQTRMYLSQRKLQKLENTLADAKMIIETDPVGCSGRAAGWLYMNDVRDLSGQLAILNVHRPKYAAVYKHLHGKAVKSCKRALDNFNRDGGKDGPFGIGFALCRLAILLLRCGDNGLTMNVQQPDTDDIEMAGKYIRQLEDSDIAIPKILEVHYLIAKCDLQYRRNKSIRALEHAEAAYKLATEINMLEFIEHAHNRVVFLRAMPVFIKAVDEEDVSRILFDDSADSVGESAE